jgi:hypothetical protein
MLQLPTLDLDSFLNRTLVYNHSARTEQKIRPNSAPIVVCLPIRCLETRSSIVACVFVVAGVCLPSRCLSIDVYSDFTIPAFGRHDTLLPPSVCSSRMAYTRTAISFPRAVFATSVIVLTFQTI